MSRILFLSVIFSPSLICAMDNISIMIENNSNQLVSIGYKDRLCIVEKLRPHTRLVLSAPTSFLVVGYQGQCHKFSIGNAHQHHFTIASQKYGKKDTLVISQYDDQHVFGSKKNNPTNNLSVFE